MQLIYRGNTYNYTLLESKLYIKARALNWRFHAPGETYDSSITPKPYIRPRALNWRFQTSEWNLSGNKAASHSIEACL